MLQLILILISLILFALAFFNVPSKWSLIAGGLFCVVLADHLGIFHR